LLHNYCDTDRHNRTYFLPQEAREVVLEANAALPLLAYSTLAGGFFPIELCKESSNVSANNVRKKRALTYVPAAHIVTWSRRTGGRFFEIRGGSAALLQTSRSSLSATSSSGCSSRSAKPGSTFKSLTSQGSPTLLRTSPQGRWLSSFSPSSPP
jgi:hypothetical protein